MFDRLPAWAKQKEVSIEKYFKDKVESIGGKTYKFASPGQRDVPDRIALFPNGRLIFAELKRPGETPTPGQTWEINELQNYGQIVVVLSTREEINECINMVCS